MKSKFYHRSAAWLFCCAALAQLTACSSPIIFHDTPLSEQVTAQTQEPVVTAPIEDTAPVTEDTTAPAETDVPVTKPVVDPEAEAKAALSALRREDLDGMNILIASASDSAVFGDSIDADTAQSTVLSTQRQNRIRMVEERYNVRILNFSFEKEALYREIHTAYLSDVPYVADFYALPYDQVGRFQAKGLLLNLRTLPFTDFTASYFDRSAMKALSAGYGVWGAVGDYTFSPENYYAVFFNRELNEQLGLTLPYAQVADGTWTWETMLAASRTARASTDGDDWGDNLSNLGLSVCEPLMLDSAALRITQTGADMTPSLSADTDKLTAIVSLLRDGVQNSKTSPTGDAAQYFTEGEMLYCVSTLSNVPAWADVKAPWGLLPLPKLNTAQKNYNTYVGQSAVLCVPSTTGALEETGMVLQALFASASGGIVEPYLDEALKYFVRDSESVEMLDLICSSAHYDFTSMFASGYTYLGYASTYAVHSGVTLGYSPKNVYENYKASAAKELSAAFPTGS